MKAAVGSWSVDDPHVGSYTSTRQGQEEAVTISDGFPVGTRWPSPSDSGIQATWLGIFLVVPKGWANISCSEDHRSLRFLRTSHFQPVDGQIS